MISWTIPFYINNSSNCLTTVWRYWVVHRQYRLLTLISFFLITFIYFISFSSVINWVLMCKKIKSRLMRIWIKFMKYHRSVYYQVRILSKIGRHCICLIVINGPFQVYEPWSITRYICKYKYIFISFLGKICISAYSVDGIFNKTLFLTSNICRLSFYSIIMYIDITTEIKIVKGIRVVYLSHNQWRHVCFFNLKFNNFQGYNC